MKIKIWGCRGSIPAPSTAEFVTNRYGGNTTCVSISAPGRLVVLDAGTGLRNLGLALAQQPGLRADFFFSHVHWDHIQGFPFFLPSFDRDSVFNLYGRSHPNLANFGGSAVANALLIQQQSLNFPVALDQMGAQLNFFNMVAGHRVELPGDGGGLAVTACELNHPGGCFGYRVDRKSGGKTRSFVFATDTEHGDKVNANLQALARGADIMLYDAQFTPEEYPGYAGWGHSTWQHGLRECSAAGIKRLLLTHHDPLRDDWALARIETDARQEGVRLGIAVDAAREGMEIEL